MDFKKITVIGGGIMGSGIAQVIATSVVENWKVLSKPVISFLTSSFPENWPIISFKISEDAMTPYHLVIIISIYFDSWQYENFFLKSLFH